MITTIREELAKPSILLDACRLDFKKHESVLRAVCRVFYNHIAKHAYIEIQEFRSLQSMAEVMDAWGIEVKRWWPAQTESGEPDMPHDTYFDRELPLYVDFSDYSGSWLIPENDSQRTYFTPVLGETPISKVRKLLTALRQDEAQGLFAPKCLEAINETFRSHHLGDDTTADFLRCLYKQAATKIERDCGISAEVFLRSTVVQWPLYPCVVHHY